MPSQGWLLPLLILGTATALGSVSREVNEESLRGALDAVARKQRSLDGNSQEYYNDLHSFKYHGDPDRKFDRERQGERQEVDEEDEEIEFLPNENGQLETVGDGYQGLNNKLLEMALIDYLENVPEQEETALFRERERSSSRKRGINTGGINLDNKGLRTLYLEDAQDRQDGSPYGTGEMDDEDYLNTLQTLYDLYKTGRNKYYENEGPMSWGELFSRQELRGNQGNEENEFVDRDQDQSVLYPAPAERRNVNGRYPIGRDFRNYRNLIKPYPIAKRSPKPMPTTKQITDPKVAQDLGALFGTQTTNAHNHTHDHEHDHEHDHDHDHDHGEQYNHENTSETPKVTPSPKGQKENVTKTTKPKSIELRKKSVDWSQYFGMDRRKKKATFMAGQGTQNQDDEWMLQRYYENMAENLRPMEREYVKDDGERKDKLDQMDTKLRNIKDLIIEEALRYADSEDSADMQKVKDKIMARMAAAYSLEKMRKALSDLRNNVAAHREAQKASQHAPTNLTSNYREMNSEKSDEKRNGDILEENEGIGDLKSCPELVEIQRSCSLATVGNQMLYFPCFMLQICKACDGDQVECLNYAAEMGKVCDAQDIREGPKAKRICAITALIISEMQPPSVATMQCRSNSDTCLRRYHYRFGHRNFRYPYQRGHRFHGDSEVSQPSDQ